MIDGDATLKAFTDAAADAVAATIAGVERDARQCEAVRAAEFRALMAEQREAMALMARNVDERMATVRDGDDGRNGRDGQDAPPVELATLREMVAEAVSAMPQPNDGKDGRDGADGTSVNLTDVEPLIADLVAAAIAALPTPIDGKDGRDGVDGRDAVSLTSALIDREGVLVLTLSDGSMHPLGIVVGDNGTDGRDGEAIKGDIGESGRDGNDGRSVDIADLEPIISDAVARAVRAIRVPEDGKDGKDGRDGADAYPGSARGLFDPHADDYRALEVVSFNGSEWRAKHDNPGALPGDGWMLSASRGKRGDRGERGTEGKAGKNADDIIAGFADPGSMRIILTRGSGDELPIDVSELIRRAA